MANHVCILILAFILGYGAVNGLPKPCCTQKSVGGISYTLVQEADTSGYNCLDNCVYKQDDAPGASGHLFCFAAGNLKMVCGEDGKFTSPPTTDQTGSSSGTRLTKRSLSSYPLAVCNDGTPAAYYTSDGMVEWSNVVVFLQEGGGCFTPQQCQYRCTVQTPSLCTDDTAEYHDTNKTMWSQEPEENPPFHDFYKIFVPFCSSDYWIGTRNASVDTGNYFFHGKFIIEAVLEDMFSKISGMKDVNQLVLMGASAGAVGVGVHCDRLAEFIHTQNSNADVRCISDGGDFYPTLTDYGCDPYQLPGFGAQFWAAELDKSCKETVNAGDPDCLLFATSFKHIETPMMVVNSYIDPSVIGQNPCVANFTQDIQVIWMKEMFKLANSFIQTKPQNGLFLSNCPFHMSVHQEFAWGDMDVSLAGRNGSEVYRNVIKNWLTGEGPFHALDSPSEKNPKCPY